VFGFELFLICPFQQKLALGPTFLRLDLSLELQLKSIKINRNVDQLQSNVDEYYISFSDLT